MDNTSKKVISIITMDKRETEKKSTNMEKACFLKAMEELKDRDVVVAEVVTDAHLQIGAVMSKY
jgi:ribonuclease HI